VAEPQHPGSDNKIYFIADIRFGLNYWQGMSATGPSDAGSPSNRQVRVLGRASGVPTADLFEVVDAPMPPCPPGGALVRVLNAAVDPAMRGWLSAEANYMTVPDGAVMRAHGVGEVIASDCPAWPVGAVVYGWLGWQRYAAVAPAEILWPVDLSVAPPEAWLSIFGLNGLTAWLGLVHLGRPKPGETVLVTTAAGGVGGVVGQLAASLDLRAVGVTGGPDKVHRATHELGYAEAIDYRAAGDGLAAAVAAACPGGIDIFFDNTAGAIADAVFPSLNVGARVIQCGTASVATWLPPPTGPRRERDVLVKRLSWHGFVAFDHQALFPEAQAALRALHAAGGLTAHDEVLHGLDQAPGAIARLYRGENTGRLSLRP
jgi:NADPH-dependent curcumin reductase CurA